MINAMQKAIIKKDLQIITSNKQVMIPFLVVPIVLTIVIPSVFILLFHFMPEEISDIEKLLALLPMEYDLKVERCCVNEKNKTVTFIKETESYAAESPNGRHWLCFFYRGTQSD